MAKLTEDPTIPTLEGWMKLVDAGSLLGMSRQYTFRLAQAGAFSTLHKIGEGDRALFIVAEPEVQGMKEARDTAAENNSKE